MSAVPQHVCHMPREIAGQVTCGFFPVPDYDVPTGLILNWGSNLLKSNEEGIIALRLIESIKKGADLIVIDPRKTHLASIAQSHLQLKPGSDIALALGLIHIIIREGLFDREFVDQWTVGFQELKEQVEAFTPERVAELTWLTAEEITLDGLDLRHLSTGRHPMGQCHRAYGQQPADLPGIALLDGHNRQPGYTGWQHPAFHADGFPAGRFCQSRICCRTRPKRC